MNTFNTPEILLDSDFIVEKKEWANTYGSDTLRLAIANNYSTNLRYFDERISIEYPGFSFTKLNRVTKEYNTANGAESNTDCNSSEELFKFPVFLVPNVTKVDSPSSFALKESLKYSGSYVASFIALPITSDAHREILVVDNYLGVCQIAKLIEKPKYESDVWKKLTQHKHLISYWCNSVFVGCTMAMFFSTISAELKFLEVLSGSPCVMAELNDITKDVKEAARKIGLGF